MLKSGASTDEFKIEGIMDGILDRFDIDGFLGFTGQFTKPAIELLRRNPLVDFIEEDSVVHTNEFDIEKGAPWGLARVSHRQPLSLSSFDQYLYDTEGGEGVTSYVIDTGINVKHTEFDGRAIWGKTIPTGDDDLDGNGHGTHCAGTIASKDYGVAKRLKLLLSKS